MAEDTHRGAGEKTVEPDTNHCDSPLGVIAAAAAAAAYFGLVKAVAASLPGPVSVHPASVEAFASVDSKTLVTKTYQESAFALENLDCEDLAEERLCYCAVGLDIAKTDHTALGCNIVHTDQHNGHIGGLRDFDIVERTEDTAGHTAGHTDERTAAEHTAVAHIAERTAADTAEHTLYIGHSHTGTVQGTAQQIVGLP